MLKFFNDDSIAYKGNNVILWNQNTTFGNFDQVVFKMIVKGKTGKFSLFYNGDMVKFKSKYNAVLLQIHSLL